MWTYPKVLECPLDWDLVRERKLRVWHAFWDGLFNQKLELWDNTMLTTARALGQSEAPNLE